MAIKHSNIFHFKALQDLPKLVFLVLKYTKLATLVHSTKTFFCLESSHVKRPN
jgi:hypothetical protein